LQALEKIVIHTNWVSFILVFLFAIVALLKIIDAEKLKGYVFAMFHKSFLEDELREDTSFFSSFFSLLFLFSCTVLALIMSLLISERNEDFSFDFSFFLLVLGIIFSYFTLKSILELLMVRLFLINKQVRFYVVSKFGYLYSISFFLLVLFVLFQFGPLNFSFFVTIASGLFFLNFVLHVFNNKSLVFSKLFYYMLYLCAFEISPLIIMFKLML
jgi:hypothetical protein